jgi:hypothetical protein
MRESKMVEPPIQRLIESGANRKRLPQKDITLE